MVPHSHPITAAGQGAAQRWAALAAEPAGLRASLFTRATRIVERIIPAPATPHGFRDPHGFVAATQVHHARSVLHKEVLRRLHVKAGLVDEYLTWPVPVDRAA